MKELSPKGNKRSWKLNIPSMTMNLKQGSKIPKFGQQRNESKRIPSFGQRNENKDFGKLNIPDHNKHTGKLNIPNHFGKKDGKDSKFNWNK